MLDLILLVFLNSHDFFQFLNPRAGQCSLTLLPDWPPNLWRIVKATFFTSTSFEPILNLFSTHSTSIRLPSLLLLRRCNSGWQTSWF